MMDYLLEDRLFPEWKADCCFSLYYFSLEVKDFFKDCLLTAHSSADSVMSSSFFKYLFKLF